MSRQRKTVREWREEKGLTQMALAIKTGASLSAIQGLESGRTEPRIGLAIKVAEALGVTLDSIDWPRQDAPGKHARGPKEHPAVA